MNGYEEIVLHVEFPQPTRMCSLCADERPIKEFPAWLPSPCGHESNACLNCIQIWIDSRLDAGAHDNITCPECNDRLAYDDVQMLATDEQFKRFDYLLTRGYLNTLGEFHWCLQPTCESGQIHDGVLGNIFQCNACMFSHCVTHKVPWHQGETCAEYDYRTDGTQRAIEEAASEQAIGAISNTCPNPLCRARINKVSGCDHMTCSRCHSSFCYICGKADAFFYGHSTQQSHEPECMYFNQQLPP